jgi:hypothetical protein
MRNIKIMEYNIGERVRIRRFEDIPAEVANKGYGKHSGKDGEIVDKLWSAARDRMIYLIRFDGQNRESRTHFVEGTFDRLSDLRKKVTYTYEFDFLENVTVARLYEIDDDGNKTEIAKGHGHLIHDGALGIAQSASYALKRIYRDLNGGEG